MKTTIDRLDVPCIEVQADELQLHDWGGLTVAHVTVHGKDGKEARFHVRIRIPDDPRGGMEGQCYAEIMAIQPHRDITREVRASWINYETWKE